MKIRWSDVVDFFKTLKENGINKPSRNNYLNGLKSFYKAIGKFKEKFEEIKIGKKRAQVKPVSLTHSLIGRRRIYLRRKNGPICRRF